jgi:anthranilate phosphoribosyltransferase
MTVDFKELIQLAYEDRLDLNSTKKAFMQIMNGEISEIQISSFISLLQKSGVKSHHVIAALEVMRKKMLVINAPLNTMDTCGTGGDGKNSLNISTATAFVLAASGIPIAKHGNRALTSKCGSADVLKALNINVDMETSKLEDCLGNTGICFMFAPNHHPAMKHVAKVRQLLGFRTIFNMLGPLLNPANVRNQIVGVYSKEVFNIYKDVFEKEDKNVCLIAGHDGNDEISLSGINLIFTNKNGITQFDPKILDCSKMINDEIKGSDNTVCANAAFGVLINQSEDFNEKNILKAFNEVQLIIESGEPLRIIEKLSKFTNL